MSSVFVVKKAESVLLCDMSIILQTPLTQAHIELGATMVEFAGYSMPVKYKQGLIEEHNWTRSSCGIFDVSHMGQIIFEGENLNEIFSKLTPSNFEKVKESVCKYTVLTNENGGIIDDLIVTKFAENRFFVVWNASRKNVDLAHLLQNFPKTQFQNLETRALIAVQGPEVFSVLSSIFPEISEIGYMTAKEISHSKYGKVILSRTGYTGEKGFEVSIEENFANDLWSQLLSNEKVRPIGLGARDSLRLEVGYPLYGNDLNSETNPISAGLSWVMSKNHTGYIGAEKIPQSPSTKRVGILLQDKGVLRAGYEIFNANGEKISVLTSGGYSPVLEKSIGQAYLPSEYEFGHEVFVEIRGKKLKAVAHGISFITTNPR